MDPAILTREVYRKPHGDLQEVPDVVEDEESDSALVRETMHVLHVQEIHEKSMQTAADKEVKQRAAAKKLEERGLRKKLEDRLDSQHQQLFEEVSFTDDNLDTGYVYERLLVPGDLLLQFLAPKEPEGATRPDVPSYVLAKQQQRKNLKRLRMWMPDTVVHTGADGPFWLFTHRDGLLYRTSSFENTQMVTRFGSRKHPTDPIAVHKESLIYPTEAPSEPPKFSYHGHKTTVINTLELETLVEAFTTAKEDSVSSVQRFIKCKGPQACIIRTMLREGKSPQGWSITNHARFDEEWSATSKEHGVPLNALSARLCTHAANRHQSKIFPLTPLALTPTVILTERTMDHLERQLRRKFEVFVADYIRDETDEYWLLQIKGFRLKPVFIHRPLTLSTKQQRMLLHSKSHYTGDDDISMEVGHQNSQINSEKALAPKNPKAHVIRTAKCHFCELDFHPSMLPYKMTLKMIHDTRRRLQLRINRNRFVKLFGNRRIKKSVDKRSSSEKTSLYRAYDVCSSCYTLYQSDVKLQIREQKFSSIMSIPTLKDSFIGNLEEQMQAAQASMRISERKNSFVSTSPRKSPRKNRPPTALSSASLLSKNGSVRPSERTRRMYIKPDARDPLIEAMHAGQSERPVPAEVTMYRLLFVFHEIHDFPQAFYDELAGKRARTEVNEDFFLVYKVLGTSCAVPLKVIETFTPEKPLFVHQLRIAYFFGAIPGPANNNLDTSRHGVDIFLTEVGEIHVNLCKGLVPDGTINTYPTITKEYGPAKLGLRQFKSKLVNKHEVYSSFGLGAGGLCSLRATIGMENVSEHLDSRLMDDDPNIHFEHGVYVPSTSFTSPSPLPKEWIDTVGTTHPHHHYHIVDRHTKELNDEAKQKCVSDPQKANLLDEEHKVWCLQVHLHAISYMCTFREDGNYDLDSKYYLEYTFFDCKFQSKDVSPTLDPYETGKPMLVFETSKKLWAIGSSSSMRHYFKTNPDVEIRIYQRLSNPRFDLKAKLLHTFNQIDLDRHDYVTLKQLGIGIVFNPSATNFLLTKSQIEERDQYLKSVERKNMNETSVRRTETDHSTKKWRKTKTQSEAKAQEEAKSMEEVVPVAFSWKHGQFADLNTLIDGLEILGESKRVEAWKKHKGQINAVNSTVSSEEWVSTALRTTRLRHIYEAAVAEKGNVEELSAIQKVRAATIAATASNSFGTLTIHHDLGENMVKDLPHDPHYDQYIEELRLHAGKVNDLGVVSIDTLVWALTEGAEKCDRLAPPQENAAQEQRAILLEHVRLLPTYKPASWQAFLRTGLSARFENRSKSPIKTAEAKGILAGTALLQLGDLSIQRELDGTFDVDTSKGVTENGKHPYPPYISASAFMLDMGHKFQKHALENFFKFESVDPSVN